MLASLLPHPRGVQFEQGYLILQAGPDAAKRLESCIVSTLGVSAAPALYKRTQLTLANGTSRMVHAVTSYPDAADYILNFKDDLLKESVDSDGNAAVWALVVESKAAADTAVSAAADQAGSTVTAAAAPGADTQSANNTAMQQGAAASKKAEPVPKVKEWHPLALDLVVIYMPCVLDPAGPPASSS